MFFNDLQLSCKDCGNTFLFTAGEQDFYQQRGLTHMPGRCPDCRNKRRALALQQGQSDVAPPDAPNEVTTIVCAACGRETTVPFRPRYVKPLYCGSCYAKMKDEANFSQGQAAYSRPEKVKTELERTAALTATLELETPQPALENESEALLEQWLNLGK